MDEALAQLRAEVATLRRELRALTDRQAIADLIACYGPAVDRGESSAAAALWLEDGTYDLGPLGTAQGRDAIAALFDANGHRQLIEGGTAHMLSPPSVTIDGDVAVAVGYSAVARWTGTNFELFRVAANRWTLRRAEGGWRVSERANRLPDGEDEARGLLRSSENDRPAG